MPTYVQGLPHDYLSQKQRLDRVNESATKVSEIAQNRLNKSEGELIVRDLQPEEDLGLTPNEFTFSVTSANATTFEEILNTEVDDNKFIVIYALSFLDADPVGTTVRFNSGATQLQEIEFENALNQEVPSVFLNSPVVYDENKTLDVELYHDVSSDTDTKIVLHGLVAEAEGENISPGEATGE